MTDEQRHDEAVSDFWAGLLASNEHASAANELDEELADALRQIHAMTLSPLPAALTRRIDLTMQAQFTTQRNGHGASRDVSPMFQTPSTRDGRRLIGSSVNPHQARRRIAEYWIAALICIVIGIAGVFVGMAIRSDSERRTTVPAAVAPDATPGPVVTESKLLEITIPSSALPRTDVGMGITRNTIKPGFVSTWIPYCCPGPMVEYVIVGTYQVRAEAEVQVFRADGTSELVAAGIEVTLQPGDALLSRNETVVESANTGADTVHLLNWVAIEDPDGRFAGHLLSGWTNNNPNVQVTDALPAAPARVTLKLFVLTESASLPEPPEGVFRFPIAMPAKLEGTPTALEMQTLAGLAMSAASAVTFVFALDFDPLDVDSTPQAGKPVAQS